MTLTEIFTSIADSIRDKTGTINKYRPEEMADAIENISGEGKYNAFIDDSKTYTNNRGIQSLITEIKGEINTSSITNFSNFFYFYVSLKKLPTIDVSNATSLNCMFEGCASLTTAPQLNTPNVRDFSRMFYNCNDLTTVPVYETTNAGYLFGGMRNMFRNCDSLSNESLNNIMEMCIGAIKLPIYQPDFERTLANIGISSEQAIRCQSLSNYQEFLDAGWTAGY